MFVIAWIFIFGAAYLFFDAWNQRQHNPNTVQVLTQQSSELVLLRNVDGHYVAEGSINGQPATFLLDTGATQVALSTRMANKLGLERGAAISVQTANGTVIAYQTRLRSIQIGPLEMRDVAAITTDNMDDATVLLGMSFLKRLEFTQRDNRLILKPMS
jgi:aspartyl protease family protein